LKGFFNLKVLKKGAQEASKTSSGPAKMGKTSILRAPKDLKSATQRSVVHIKQEVEKFKEDSFRWKFRLLKEHI